jgi:hypothetical protein
MVVMLGAARLLSSLLRSIVNTVIYANNKQQASLLRSIEEHRALYNSIRQLNTSLAEDEWETSPLKTAFSYPYLMSLELVKVKEALTS